MTVRPLARPITLRRPSGGGTEVTLPGFRPATDGRYIQKRHVLVAGGGIAGLSAALALEQKGFAVTVFEKSAEAGGEEAGAGLQLTPNASRILDGLGVLPRLTARAVQLKQIVLSSSRTGKPLLPLDISNAAKRWRAPYLSIYRPDLRAALLAQARIRPAISYRPGTEVTNFAAHANGVTVSLTSDSGISEADGLLLVGADGVWSAIRGELTDVQARFSGQVAHRILLDESIGLPPALQFLSDQRQITAFLARNAHLVAYPVRGGKALNLVAIARGEVSQERKRGAAALPAAFKLFEPGMAAFMTSLDGWSQYPIHTINPKAPWSDGRRALLIGDAAHAMAPYAAQGAAMAIEDAWVMANCLASSRDDASAAIRSYETLRRPRIRRIAARAAANRFAYHASGPAAWARDALFRARGQKMLDGLDWIYGWQAPA